jgi:hypothetical protein
MSMCVCVYVYVCDMRWPRLHKVKQTKLTKLTRGGDMAQARHGPGPPEADAALCQKRGFFRRRSQWACRLCHALCAGAWP